MLQFFLVFVGIALFVNGVRICYSLCEDESKHIGGKDTAVINLFTGLAGLILIVALAFKTAETNESMAPAAYMGLFALTYLWLGINEFTGADGKALGWFSLLVPFIGIPVAIISFNEAVTPFDYWMVFNWLAWSLLWFMFFLLSAKKMAIAKITGIMTATQGIFTALLPAVLSFWGYI